VYKNIKVQLQKKKKFIYTMITLYKIINLIIRNLKTYKKKIYTNMFSTKGNII